MSARKDLTGKKFGKIKVLEFVGHNNTHTIYKCLCTRCGKELEVPYSNLISGNTKSCQSCGNKIPEELELIIKNALLEDEKISHIAKKYNVNRSVVYRIKKEIEEHNNTKGSLCQN